MVLKGKALKRAMKSKDAIRVNGDIPLITDTTELITPTLAEKMLRHNKTNRPINWNKVDEFCKIMEKKEWKFHGQGIIFDNKGNLLTGQKRLWAIIYSGESQYMRVSKGSPPDTANFIDRGVTQSVRDLASRATDRKHSPTEGSIVRGVCALSGIIKPSHDKMAEMLVTHDDSLKEIMKGARGIKKTKSLLFILAAICSMKLSRKNQMCLLGQVEQLSLAFDTELEPIEAVKCWNRGAAFTFAMEKALTVCKRKGCEYEKV